MLFSKNLLAAFLAVAAVGVSGSPVELEKRKEGKITLSIYDWSPESTDGHFDVTFEENWCFDLGSNLNDKSPPPTPVPA